MGISVKDFRLRIGTFLRKNMNRKYKSKVRINTVNYKNKTFLLVILILIIELQASSINQKSNKFHRASETSESSFKYFREVGLNNYDSFISCWPHLGMTVNKIQKMYNGNRRAVGYKFAVWNCGRGLVQDVFSTKLEEVKQFIAKNKPHPKSKKS